MNKKNTILLSIIGVALFVVLLFVSGTVYYVNEMENAVVTRFGKVQYAVLTGFDPTNKESDEQIKELKKRYPDQIHTGAGLYFKVPFIDKTHYFDSRLLHWDGEIKNVSTMDLRTLRIDTGAFWRILDVIKFFEALGRKRQALNRIGGVINSQIEDMVSSTRLIEAVRNENLELDQRVKKRLETAEGDEEPKSAAIRYGRRELLQKIIDNAAPELMKRFGIKLEDVMFTKLNYTQSVRKNVFDRMIAERKRIAARYRAQGEQTKREILGKVSKRKAELLSQADRETREILGDAEGKRIQIHAEAFNRNPAFYRFHRSLETYRDGLGKNAHFLLTDDNRLLEFTSSDELKE